MIKFTTQLQKSKICRLENIPFRHFAVLTEPFEKIPVNTIILVLQECIVFFKLESTNDYLLVKYWSEIGVRKILCRPLEIEESFTVRIENDK